MCAVVPVTLISQTPYYDKTKEGYLVFHSIRVDKEGKILPWFSDDPGEAYDHVVNAVWTFWDTMRRDLNGLPYYMNHQVWRPLNDPRGLGGDQFAMALSSWHLLYQYSGNEKIKENMKFIADYYMAHSLSPADSKWPHLPYPYNSSIYSGFYDGDMVLGKNFTQPDKAGSIGWELLTLFKLSGNYNYLQYATDIANTLARNTVAGDYDHSPLPFKVNTGTGRVGELRSNTGSGSVAGTSSYTTNWSGTMNLFLELKKMKKGEPAQYQAAFEKLLAWMKSYPMKNNRWGPFFEDIPGWSDTQINAVTWVRFILEHREYFPGWKQDARKILDWVYERLGNNEWQRYGVKAVNEQTAYLTPGNSHTSRQAAAELLYARTTGDTTNKEIAIRQLNWATYMVDHDGKNNYPRDEVWLTDGYGDYVRHYLRAMAAYPGLAPNSNHILHSTSIVTQADYAPNFNKRLDPDVKKEDINKVLLFYRTYDNSATEVIRLAGKPGGVYLGAKDLKEIADFDAAEGWQWVPLHTGGILTVKHATGREVTIYK